MKINVKVVPNAKRTAVREEEGRLKVYVTAPAVEGKANEALVEALAEHFGVKKRAVAILRGETSREKLVEVDLEPRK